MATEWGGWTWNGTLTAFRRSTGLGPGETGGKRASGATTKILSFWYGGYREKYGCTGKGVGVGGGRQRRAPRWLRGVKSAEDTYPIGLVGMVRRIEDLKTIGGVSSPTPLHPHPSQVPPAA